MGVKGSDYRLPVYDKSCSCPKDVWVGHKVGPTRTSEVIEQEFWPRRYDRPDCVLGCVDLSHPFRFPKAAYPTDDATRVASDEVTERRSSIEHTPEKPHIRGLGYEGQKSEQE